MSVGGGWMGEAVGAWLEVLVWEGLWGLWGLWGPRKWTSASSINLRPRPLSCARVHGTLERHPAC